MLDLNGDFTDGILDKIKSLPDFTFIFGFTPDRLYSIDGTYMPLTLMFPHELAKDDELAKDAVPAFIYTKVTLNTGFKEIPTQELNFLWECYKQSRSSLEVYEELAEKYKIASS